VATRADSASGLSLGTERGVSPPAARWDEYLFRAACFSAATLLMAALAGVVISLAIGGWPAFKAFGWRFFVTAEWNPVTDLYGAAGPIAGTLITGFLALLFALPLAMGVAIFLTEFCPRRLAQPIAVAIELLAGIPSIVYGMWGLFVFAPWFAAHVQTPLAEHAAQGSWLASLFAGVPNGANIFTASVILAIMILPYMAAVFRELFLSVPAQVREAAFGLGSTAFEAVAKVIVPYVRRGVVGVVMLGLGRALGETMAVTFIIGNAHGLPHSLFDAGSTIASTIANEFTEATGELHEASLIALGLVLFIITFAVLAIARVLLKSERH
jgi:phosphate transport system permease protein